MIALSCLILLCASLVTSTVAPATWFQESAIDSMLHNLDLSGLEALIQSSWSIESSHFPISSEKAALVLGEWDDTLTCRCSALARINIGQYSDEGMWWKLMDSMYPVDSPARFQDFPHLTACLLLDINLPLSKRPIPSHWNWAQIVESVRYTLPELRLDGWKEKELVSFESIFGTPIPFLQEIAARGLNVIEAMHFDLFEKYGLRVKAASPAASVNLYIGHEDLDLFKKAYQQFPQQLAITCDTLCYCLENGDAKRLEWALSVARPEANLQKCPAFHLRAEHIPTYDLAHAAKGWLPTRQQVNDSFIGGRYEEVEWAITASDLQLYPTSELLDFVLAGGDVTMIRLLHSLKPIDFVQRYYQMDEAKPYPSLKPLGLDLLKWFPEFKQRFLDTGLVYSEDVTGWLHDY